jgi:hypothetical protein
MRYLYLSLALMLGLSACSPKEIAYGIKLSIEDANDPETGNSSYTTADILRNNVAMFLDYMFDCGGDDNLPQFFQGEFPGGSHKDEAQKGWMLGGDLELVGKGYSVGGAKVKMTYLELPVTAMYQYPLGPGGLQGGLGPFVAYGIGGKSGGEPTFGDGANDGGFKRFDAGAAFRVGYALNMGLSLHLGYDLGLVGIVYPGQDYNAKNRAWSLSLGYNFFPLLHRKN